MTFISRHLLAGYPLAGVVSFCLSTTAFAQEQDWNKVIEAAKKEGSVTVYHAQLGAPHWKIVVADFEKRYGIRVQEFDARAVYRGRVRRRVHKANPDRLLRYVIAAVRAGEESDREVTAQEGTTLALHRELQTAAESLEKAGARLEDAALCEEAAHYKRSIKRIERAIREQLSPRLIQLFDAPADAPLPALTITTTPAANV